MDFSLTQTQTARKKTAITFTNEHLQQDLDTLDHHLLDRGRVAGLR